MSFERNQKSLLRTRTSQWHITSYYSATEVKELLGTFELLCERQEGTVLYLLLEIVKGNLRDSPKSRRSHIA